MVGVRESLHTSKMAHQAEAYPGFYKHEATRSISTPPWMGCQSITGLPPALSSPVPICQPGVERHCESKVSCPRTQHNVPGQGSNPDRSIQR